MESALVLKATSNLNFIASFGFCSGTEHYYRFLILCDLIKSSNKLCFKQPQRFFKITLSSRPKLIITEEQINLRS